MIDVNVKLIRDLTPGDKVWRVTIGAQSLGNIQDELLGDKVFYYFSNTYFKTLEQAVKFLVSKVITQIELKISVSA